MRPVDRLRHLGDVVDAQDVGALGGGEDGGGDRAAEPVVHLGAVDLADEALARGADDQRPAQLAQLAEPAQQLEVVLERLAEADPGIEPDPLLVDPGGDRDLHPLGEEGLDLVDHVVVARVVLHRPRVALHVHQHQPGTPLRAQSAADLRDRAAAR